LYLLTEADENLLDETADLILLDRGQLALWLQEAIATGLWSEKSITPSSWTKKTINNPAWGEVSIH